MNARPKPLPARRLPLPRSAPLLAALAASALSPALLAQERPGAPAPETSAILPRVAAKDALSSEQRAFFRDLALTNAKQLALAAEASGRATQSETRDFADWVRREHQIFADDLGTLAKALGDESVARSEPLTLEERPAWANRNDSGYDEGYSRATAELANRLVERLETVKESPQKTVSAFAQKHLPGLRSRIQRAQDLRRAF